MSRAYTICVHKDRLGVETALRAGRVNIPLLKGGGVFTELRIESSLSHHSYAVNKDKQWDKIKIHYPMVL
jgi:hypothetical protein